MSYVGITEARALVKLNCAECPRRKGDFASSAWELRGAHLGESACGPFALLVRLVLLRGETQAEHVGLVPARVVGLAHGADEE